MVADVNGDGIPDVLVHASNTVTIYPGKGNGTFATPINYGAGPSSTSFLAVNLQGQLTSTGKPDLVFTNTTGVITVLYNLTQ
ncbi:MAG: VCBS repeat-containing protein [Bryobacteraceae bacterium]